MPRAEQQKAISFNVTVDQLSVIRQTAELNGMDVSSLVRSALFDRVRALNPGADLRASSRPSSADKTVAAAPHADERSPDAAEQAAPKTAPPRASKKQARAA
jgi:hypothetical protein